MYHSNSSEQDNVLKSSNMLSFLLLLEKKNSAAIFRFPEAAPAKKKCKILRQKLKSQHFFFFQVGFLERAKKGYHFTSFG